MIGDVTLNLINVNVPSDPAPVGNRLSVQFGNDHMTIGDIMLNNNPNSVLTITGDVFFQNQFFFGNVLRDTNYHAKFGNDMIRVGNMHLQSLSQFNIIVGDIILDSETTAPFPPLPTATSATTIDINYGNDDIRTGELFEGVLSISGDAIGELFSISPFHIQNTLTDASLDATLNYGNDVIKIGVSDHHGGHHHFGYHHKPFYHHNDPPMNLPEGILTIVGDITSEILQLESDDDTLDVNYGNDVIDAGKTNDVIVGDTDSFILVLDESMNTVNIDYGNDKLSGDRGNDQVFGDASEIILMLDGDEHAIIIDLGNDTIWGNDGEDILVGDVANGLSIDDSTGYENTISINFGNDRIKGGDGKDKIAGDIFQQNSLSLLDPSNTAITYGNDVMTGGDGADEFHFFLHDLDASDGDDFALEGDDVITDLSMELDEKIVIHQTTETGVTPADITTILSFSEDGDDILIESVDGGSIRLLGTVVDGSPVTDLTSFEAAGYDIDFVL